MPEAIIILSGKRKSGKDFIAVALKNVIGNDKCGIIRLSAPLKRQYAHENGLDFAKLLSSNAYKELYREDMIKWGEDKRNSDPGYFCSISVQEDNDQKIWIVSDARRLTDITYFETNFPNCKILLVRINASKAIRKVRGWVYTSGIDDQESECGLDKNVKWDYIIENNDNCCSMYSDDTILAIKEDLYELFTNEGSNS